MIWSTISVTLFFFIIASSILGVVNIFVALLAQHLLYFQHCALLDLFKITQPDCDKTFC